MGCRILEDPENGCCFFDSVTGQAFGPVFERREHIEAFERWLGETYGEADPRQLAPAYLRQLCAEWTAVFQSEAVTVGQVWTGLTGNRMVIREVKDGRARLSYEDDPGDETWEDCEDIRSSFTLVR